MVRGTHRLLGGNGDRIRDLYLSVFRYKDIYEGTIINSSNVIYRSALGNFYKFPDCVILISASTMIACLYGFYWRLSVFISLA